MRYLITGVHGMAGSHLAEYLLHNNRGVVGGIARTSISNAIPSEVEMYSLDLQDYSRVKQCLADFRPDVIFHLAAQTFVPEAWKNPKGTFQNNTLSEMNLFEAILDLGLKPTIHIASSSEVYGKVSEHQMPLREDSQLSPTNPYAVSKVAQEFIGMQYRESHQMNVIITRTFNHTGPRRGEQYVESSFAKQLVEIELGMRDPEILVGNLLSRREFTDVRDVVRAYSDLIVSGAANGVYLICSGQAISIAQLLHRLISLTGLTVRVKRDPTRLRKADVPVLYGDNFKIVQTVQWRPRFTLDQTLQDLLEYWRSELRAG